MLGKQPAGKMEDLFVVSANISAWDRALKLRQCLRGGVDGG